MAVRRFRWWPQALLRPSRRQPEATLNPVYDAPIAEVSGACFVGDRLVLVGDAKPVLAWTTWNEGPGTWETLNVARLTGAPSDTGQFEAVEHVGGDTVVILCEEPALLVAVDLVSRTVTGWWHLSVDLKGIAKAWRKDQNSHGEGLFFGHDRVYVVKEKKPAVILEFGLPGQRSAGQPRPGTWAPPPSGELVALASWEVDLSDVSDVCVHDGQVWLLSDQEACFGPMGSAQTPLGLPKPEGLARTPEGTWLVTLDNPDGRGALRIVQ